MLTVLLYLAASLTSCASCTGRAADGQSKLKRPNPERFKDLNEPARTTRSAR